MFIYIGNFEGNSDKGSLFFFSLIMMKLMIMIFMFVFVDEIFELFVKFVVLIIFLLNNFRNFNLSFVVFMFLWIVCLFVNGRKSYCMRLKRNFGRWDGNFLKLRDVGLVWVWLVMRNIRLLVD